MRRADKEFDEHIEPAEWAAFMSEVYGELYAVVCDAGDQYFATSGTITATGADSYDEFDDHLSTLAFFRVTDASGRLMPLEKIEVQERHMYAGETGDASAYELIDNLVYFYPNPTSGTYKLFYIPQPPDLTSYADADLLDVVNTHGEAFLMYGVAALAKAKAEEDPRFYLDQKERAKEGLRDWAINRSFHDPHRRQTSDFDLADRPYRPGDYR